MSAAHDGGPAFPVADWDHQTFAPGTVEEVVRLLSGMSLRDYFAAHAPEPPLAWRGGDRAISDCIAWRYYYADAMLRERAK